MKKKYFDQYTDDPWSKKSTNVLKSGPYTYNEERGVSPSSTKRPIQDTS